MSKMPQTFFPDTVYIDLRLKAVKLIRPKKLKLVAKTTELSHSAYAF